MLKYNKMLKYADPIYRNPPDSTVEEWGLHLPDTKVRRYLSSAEMAYDELVKEIDSRYLKLDDCILYVGQLPKTVGTVLNNIVAWYQFYESILYNEIKPIS